MVTGTSGFGRGGANTSRLMANGFDEREPSPNTLAACIKEMLAWQNCAQAHLLAIREQLELSQWALFIKQEIDDGELGSQEVTDPNTPRDLLALAAHFFEDAQGLTAAFLR